VNVLLENIAEEMTFLLLKNKIIKHEDSDIYIYGFQVMISSLMVTISLLTLGIALNKLLMTLVFMFVFVSLRINTGGYHANKFRECLTFSLIIYLMEILLVKFIPNEYKGIVSIILLSFGTSIIFAKAPIEHKNNPLTLKEKIKYKKISRMISLVLSIVILIGIFMKQDLIDYYLISSLTVMAVAILIIIPLLKRREKND
jgi:accessory gene regulator B